MSFQPLADNLKPLDVFATIADDLRRVETAIEAALSTREKMLEEVSIHLLRAGGKRIRPALVILSSRFPGVSLDKVIDVAVAVELIHMATLVHDDVVDNATLRRGRPTVNAIWDNQVSVLVGDYLFAKSFTLLSETGNNRVVRLMSEVVREMSQGELAQMASYFDVEQTEEDYFKRIAQKTGYLIAEACRLGAVMAGAGEEEVDAVYEYGMGIGLSFQIADDLLDFFGDESTLGKPVCGDLKIGILTLPVIHALHHSPMRGELREIIGTRSIGAAEVERVKEILAASGSFDYAREKAREHIDRAVRALERVPTLTTRPVLKTLADFVVNRKF
ncbi:MAG: polyprenyl synthetase family protein [Symbiobacterium sp.]|uniref:polyprenyl synthetase family protein n=1 Tax=Symbiobacterium sp. TaxID=1971213 RepID=UPI003464AADB